MNRIFLIFIVLSLVNGGFNTAPGLQLPEMSFNHFRVADGLSHNLVQCIYQDRTGFLWIGTRDGLNRFDGYTFKIFRHDSTNPRSISNNNIQCIFEDRNGIFWIGTWNGLNRFDPATEHFTAYIPRSGNPHSLNSRLIYSVCEDSSGWLWIGTYMGGLNYFDPHAENFYHFQHDSLKSGSLSSDHIRNALIDQNHQLWIGTLYGGLNRLDLRPIYAYKSTQASSELNTFLQKQSFIHFRNAPRNPTSLSHDNVGKIYEDKSGTIWVGTTRGGLNRFVPETGDFIRYHENPQQTNRLALDFVNTIHEDYLGNLWFGTWGSGLKIVTPQQRKKIPAGRIKPVPIIHDPDQPKSLSSDEISYIFEDRTGIIWIGTMAGLNQLVLNQPNFINWTASRRKVLSILEEPDGGIWVGTDKGLHYLKAGTQLNEKSNSTKFRFTSNTTKLVSENYILSMLKAPDGRFWLGTGNGLIQFNVATREAEHYTQISPPAPKNTPVQPVFPEKQAVSNLVSITRKQAVLSDRIVTCLLADRNGTLWIGTRQGLHRMHPRQQKFRCFRPTPGGLVGRSVHVLLEDRAGKIWIGTGSGLNCLDPVTEKFTNFPVATGKFCSQNITALLEDQDGHLWVGTAKALNKFNCENAHIECFVKNRYIQSILADSLGNLWLSTNDGLIKLNPRTGTRQNYGLNAGLPDEHFLPNACFKSSSSDFLYFGTMRGLIAFQPGFIRENITPPPVVLTEFLIFNKPVTAVGSGATPLEQTISCTEEIILAYDQNVLSFKLAVLDFTNPAANQFAYQLAGINPNWVETGNRRTIDFTRLPPDDYTLRVKGANSSGVWNATGVNLNIRIRPPWWRTWPAYLAYLLMALGSLYALRQADRRRTQLKNELKMQQFQAEQLQEIDRLKSRFFANISHEFRTPITLILGPLEKWRTRMKDAEARRDFSIVRRNVQRLQRLINQLLDLSKIEAGKMVLNSSTQDLVRLVNYSIQSFESLAKLKEIDLKFSPQVPQLFAQVDSEKIENIIYNLVSNALKFTPKGGRVEVKIMPVEQTLPDSPDSDWVEIRVSDTGIGIPPEQAEKIFNRFYQVDDSFVRAHAGSGIGLSLTKELVDLHGGTISVSSKPGEGSIFTVRLPVGEVDFPVEIEEIQPEVVHVNLTESAPACPEPTAKRGKSRILIVEDNADLRTFIRDILKNDFACFEAADGVTGFASAIQHVPDLIVSDVMMPKMDGFQFCAKVKTNELTSHIPVILLTARVTRESKIEGLETGADDYLIKPFDATELQIRIRNLITQRQRLRERFRQQFVVEPREISVTSADERFLQRALDIFEAHFSDPEFSTDAFARKMGTSRSQLHRKLQALTGQSATEFLRTIRLKRAASLIKQGYGNISEIAFAVGFNHLSYFTECFRKQFGVAPSEYA